MVEDNKVTHVESNALAHTSTSISSIFQAEFADHTPPMSIHASHENFGIEAHQGFLNVMKESRSAGNLREDNSFRENTTEIPGHAHNSQVCHFSPVLFPDASWVLFKIWPTQRNYTQEIATLLEKLQKVATHLAIFKKAEKYISLYQMYSLGNWGLPLDS